MQPSSGHAMTTAVMGHCGVGFGPVRTQDHQRLVGWMEGVEDISGAARHKGLSQQREGFGGFLDALAPQPRGIDMAARLPHGALRVFVMGECGARLEADTPEGCHQMRHLAAEAMRAGAIGFPPRAQCTTGR